MSQCEPYEDREDCLCPERTECIDTCSQYRGGVIVGHRVVNTCICPGKHRCWKESCQEEYPFGEKHECDACPCGGDHPPDEHKCLGCGKLVYYPTELNHCCPKSTCSVEKPCGFHRAKTTFVMIAEMCQLPKELIETIIDHHDSAVFIDQICVDHSWDDYDLEC